MQEVAPHAGLALTEALSQIPNNDLETAIGVTCAAVEQWKIQEGSPEHEILLSLPDMMGLEGTARRQLYYRSLFGAVAQNGK